MERAQREAEVEVEPSPFGPLNCAQLLFLQEPCARYKCRPHAVEVGQSSLDCTAKGPVRQLQFSAFSEQRFSSAFPVHNSVKFAPLQLSSSAVKLWELDCTERSVCRLKTSSEALTRANCSQCSMQCALGRAVRHWQLFAADCLPAGSCVVPAPNCGSQSPAHSLRLTLLPSNNTLPISSAQLACARRQAQAASSTTIT